MAMAMVLCVVVMMMKMMVEAPALGIKPPFESRRGLRGVSHPSPK